MLDLEYTRHAMAERRIPSEWVELAVTEPALRMGDPTWSDSFALSRNTVVACCEWSSTPALFLGA